MAKAKDTKRVVDSYTIKGTNKVVKAGDCVLMKPCKDNVHSYVARVEKIEAYNRNNMKVRVRWYYWPEETFGGRKKFHGAKELFLSDHYDIQSAQAIYGKCIIHSFKNYTKLQNVEEEDYYCRFEYKPQLEKFLPDHVAVYCKCEMPYNPDDLMIQCEECKDWFHPECIGMTVEEAKQLKEFVCSEHSIDEDVQKPTKRVCSEHSSVEDMKKPTTLANGKQFVSSEHSFDDDFGKPTSFANHKQFVCSEHSCNEDVKNPSAFANRKQFVRAEHS